MINDPRIMSLLLIGLINSILLLAAVVFSYNIYQRWNVLSSSEYQLKLERTNYLVSTIIMYSFAFEIISSLLFIITVNSHLPQLIKGAMCATGVLNVNQYGWYSLLFRILEFILLSLWLFINYTDNKFPEYPLTKIKYSFLLTISPIIVATYIVEILFFLNIETNIITTCCSISFSATSDTIQRSSFNAIINENTILLLFYISYIILICLSLYLLFSKNYIGFIKTTITTVSGLIYSFIAFLSLTFHFSKYIYGMPSHLCPFDMLWQQYYFVGYLIYGLLLLVIIISIYIWINYVISKKEVLKVLANSFYRKFIIGNIISSTIIFLLLSLIKIYWQINY